MGQEASGKGESPSVVGGTASGDGRHLGGFILPKSRAKRPHAELGFQFSKLRFCRCQNQKTVRLMTTFSPLTPPILIQQWFSSAGGVLPQGAVATSGTPVVDTPAGVALPGPKPGGCSQGPGRQGWRGRDCWLVARSPAGHPTPGETRRRQALRTDPLPGACKVRVCFLSAPTAKEARRHPTPTARPLPLAVLSC